MSSRNLTEALRYALREMLELQSKGASHPKLSRAQGVVDGYMRALLDAGLASQRELLALVAEERTSANGAPTKLVEHVRAVA